MAVPGDHGVATLKGRPPCLRLDLRIHLGHQFHKADTQTATFETRSNTINEVTSSHHKHSPLPNIRLSSLLLYRIRRPSSRAPLAPPELLDGFSTGRHRLGSLLRV
ncbi:hypothetical protein VTI74DRAFT_112 [Chaetomium olivicolor]